MSGNIRKSNNTIDPQNQMSGGSNHLGLLTSKRVSVLREGQVVPLLPGRPVMDSTNRPGTACIWRNSTSMRFTYRSTSMGLISCACIPVNALRWTGSLQGETAIQRWTRAVFYFLRRAHMTA